MPDDDRSVLFKERFRYVLQYFDQLEKQEVTVTAQDELLYDLFSIERFSITKSRRGNNRHYYSYTCNENDCGHKIYIDYCWNCKTKLFKHGSYWDYHLEPTWSMFDIRCPNCGMTIADMPQTANF